MTAVATATDYVALDKTSIETAINTLNPSSSDRVIRVVQGNSVAFIKIG